MTAECIVIWGSNPVNSQPAVIPWGYGLDKQGINATQCARARAILRAIIGNLEVPGGENFSQAGEVGKIRDWEYLEMNEAISPRQQSAALLSQYAAGV